MTQEQLKEAVKIRCVEQTFLRLFSQGRLNGTVHTCVGQEWSAVALCGQLGEADSVVSNHRCHGHYISFTKDYKGLIAELMGKGCGVCGGVGSSQHLHKGNFFSNGIQGGMVPVAAGLALAKKLSGEKGVVVAFIGEGTLGEGVVYETMNIASKWELPLLIVCENNRYSQSTPQDIALAGDICARAEAFSIRSFKSNTWDVDDLISAASESIQYVRTQGKPAFHLVETYRLNAHSKGDDDRDKAEIQKYQEKDSINAYARKNPGPYKEIEKEVQAEIDTIVTEMEKTPALLIDEYFPKSGVSDVPLEWRPENDVDKRYSTLINEFFTDAMKADPRVVFMGEDVLSPYGGAFKVANGLSDKFPDRVFSTPISEAAIVGIGNGLALAGFKPYVELMFGDFITLAFDQLVNHASKFHHMYNRQISCPLVVRTPMGGRRGYGPTHSQTLDRFLIGIDNVKTVALNRMADPRRIYQAIYSNEIHPVIVIENKSDYAKKYVYRKILNYQVLVSTGNFPWVRIAPAKALPDLTIFAYGGMLEIVLDTLEPLFNEFEVKVEVLAPTLISPCDIRPVLASVMQTRKLLVIEEGNMTGGVGAEIVAQLAASVTEHIQVKRIGALPVPIAACPSLEELVLPGPLLIINAAKEMVYGD
ncbi:MAG: thiamine pyrophosphate-dependent enzyme [Fibrobacterota bacterium]